VAHVELSLSELNQAGVARSGARGYDGALDRWALAVAAATEACLLLDATGIVVAASPSAGALLTVKASDAVGRRLLDGVLRLRDFNAVAGELPGWEVDKIPPLLAMTTGGLARGLLRVAGADGAVSTLDAISTPLRDGATVVGSLTFFAPVGR
jgi:PAS domain-containing protein